MSVKETLHAEMKNAMRAREKVRLETIRSVLSAIQYEEIQKQVPELNDEGVLAVLKTELKKRKEAIEYAEKGGREEMMSTLKHEISTLEGFLPKQLSSEDLERELRAMKAQEPGIGLGQAMKLLKERFPGQYDGKTASAAAKQVLES